MQQYPHAVCRFDPHPAQPGRVGADAGESENVAGSGQAPVSAERLYGSQDQQAVAIGRFNTVRACACEQSRIVLQILRGTDGAPEMIWPTT